jgi:hypothetical protein
MNLSALNMLVLIPLLSLGLVVITWWLPWERVLDLTWHELQRFSWHCTSCMRPSSATISIGQVGGVRACVHWGIFSFVAIRESAKNPVHG